MSGYSNQCLTCKNYTMLAECLAFPDGIPEVILTGEFDHTNPYPNDNGIKYEKIKTRNGTVDFNPIPKPRPTGR